MVNGRESSWLKVKHNYNNDNNKCALSFIINYNTINKLILVVDGGNVLQTRSLKKKKKKCFLSMLIKTVTQIKFSFKSIFDVANESDLNIISRRQRWFGRIKLRKQIINIHAKTCHI